MEKVDLTFILYDEMVGGNYIYKKTGYRLDEEYVVFYHEIGPFELDTIEIIKISAESEYNGIIILIGTRKIFINVWQKYMNNFNFDLTHPSFIEFCKYLVTLPDAHVDLKD